MRNSRTNDETKHSNGDGYALKNRAPTGSRAVACKRSICGASEVVWDEFNEVEVCLLASILLLLPMECFAKNSRIVKEYEISVRLNSGFQFA